MRVCGGMALGQAASQMADALINREMNYQMLQEIPYIRFLDLAIIFFIPVRITESGMDRILIKKSMMDEWGVTNPEALYNEAQKNTCRIFSGRIDTMGNVCKEMKQITDPELFREFEEINAISDESPTLFVATNSQALHGANVILYDRLLNSFANMINDDLVILPSSIHECMIIPASSAVDIDSLKRMVISINRKMKQDEVLSDNIYCYDRTTDQITIIR